MSIYDNAGVALIPSGTKASKLYSVLPANGDGDFNATRGSTATRVNKDGFIESVATNVPRLDYPLIDGEVQDCPALLLEPQRQNRFIRSEEFDNATWGKENITVSSNQAISPDGSQTADAIFETTSNSLHRFYDGDYNRSDENTISIFAKYNGSNLALRFSTSSADTTYFDLENGTIESQGSNDAKMIAYPNGWYRCIITDDPSGTTDPIFNLYQTSGTLTYTGNTSNGVYLWGAQAELASYETSYIPTTSLLVTRSADVCNGSGTSAEFNDSEGVLFAEIQALADDLTFRRLTISDNSYSNTIDILITNITNQIRVLIRDNNVTTSQMSHTVSNIVEFNKVAIKYKSGDSSLWINGINVENISDTFTLPTLTDLSFDRGDGTSNFYGNTKQLMTFKTALTDSELETLTSWDSFNAMAKGQLYTIE